MFSRIVVPLDGSARAERAALTAARIARSAGSSLVFLRVVEVPVRTGPAFEAPPVMLGQIEQDVVGATEYLRRLAGRPEFADIPIDDVALEGRVAETILETAADEHADLLVMCSHGQGGAFRWALGSVARELARHAAIPVLILREEGAIPGGPGVTMAHTAAVALDGSAFSERGIEAAAMLLSSLSDQTPAELLLVRVVFQKDSERGAHPQEATALAEARAYLEQVLEQHANSIRPYNVRLRSLVLQGDDVAGRLINLAHAAPQEGLVSGVDFLAIATHGRGGFQRLRQGSVTERILRTSRMPLLVFPMLAPSAETTDTATTELHHD